MATTEELRTEGRPADELVARIRNLHDVFSEIATLEDLGISRGSVEHGRLKRRFKKISLAMDKLLGTD